MLRATNFTLKKISPLKNAMPKKSNVWMSETPKFKKGDMKHKLESVSSFEVNFPQYREPYIKECFPILKRIMKEQEIIVELDALEGKLKVTNTIDTWDPYSILLARDVIKLISRNVPIESAIKVFDAGTTSEIVQIKNLCKDDATFIKRRNRLLGNDNQTLLAIQLLTKCSIFVQGGTVAIIGPYEGTLKVMDIVKQCMKNVHPLYTINSLMIEKTLKENPDMQKKNWAEALPSYKPKSTTKNKKKTKREPKPFNPMPPPQPESKMDQQLAQGEYFIAKHLKSKPHLSKEEQKRKSEKIQAAKRAAQYQPPDEPVAKKQKVGKEQSVDIEKLKKKVKKQKKLLAGEITPAKKVKIQKDGSGKAKNKKKVKE